MVRVQPGLRERRDLLTGPALAAPAFDCRSLRLQKMTQHPCLVEPEQLVGRRDGVAGRGVDIMVVPLVTDVAQQTEHCQHQRHPEVGPR